MRALTVFGYPQDKAQQLSGPAEALAELQLSDSEGHSVRSDTFGFSTSGKSGRNSLRSGSNSSRSGSDRSSFSDSGEDSDAGLETDGNKKGVPGIALLASKMYVA